MGRRYSRREVIGGAGERIDEDAHHLLRLPSLKAWALNAMESIGVPAMSLVARHAGEWTNEGEVLREHVQWIDGTACDDLPWLAARVYELCRYLEIAAAPANSYEREWCEGKVPQWAFELGRVSMLAKVYGIDDAVREPARLKADAARRRYPEAEKNKWRALFAARFGAMAVRSAVRYVMLHFNLLSEAFETVRKALSKKTG